MFRQRWRSERNFWLSLMGLVLWLVLACVRGLILETQGAAVDAGLQAKEELVSEQSRGTGTRMSCWLATRVDHGCKSDGSADEVFLT